MPGRTPALSTAACIPMIVLAALVSWPAAAAGDIEAGRDKARKCRACHGIDGIARQPNVPHLAGESEMYLSKQLRAFRSGQRKDPRMSIIAQGLSDEDIADLVAWYSAIEISVELPETSGDGD